MLRKTDEFILGNPSLHLQLSTALAVMTQLICNPSRPPSAQQLAENMDLSLRYLRKLLRSLAAAGLLKPHDAYVDTWTCTRAPHLISLADLYDALTAEKEETRTPFVAPPQSDNTAASSELLMMQATMSINQIVLQHLQQFDLGRLKVAESALLFTASLRQRAGRQNWTSPGLDTLIG
jgi:DNA-binding IscR family transcriptional regulator